MHAHPGLMLSPHPPTRTMQAWREKGKRGIWLKLPASHSALVHPAVQLGFKYHHAERVRPWPVLLLGPQLLGSKAVLGVQCAVPCAR